jgi:hypothetical protein
MGVVATLFACLPGGIIAMMLAGQAKAQHAKGDYAGAKNKLLISYIISTICLVIGLPLFVLYVSQ